MINIPLMEMSYHIHSFAINISKTYIINAKKSTHHITIDMYSLQNHFVILYLFFLRSNAC